MSFQQDVWTWVTKVFAGETQPFTQQERNFRFFEEAIELVQSLGMTKEECEKLINSVYSKPIGEPFQEAGGTLLTLAALCEKAGINMESEGYRELIRINNPVIRDKIKAKQESKRLLMGNV